MPRTIKKKDTPPRQDTWSDLETPGDIRRFLRWCILGTATGKIDTRTAGVLGQLGLYALKAIEVSVVAAQVELLERRLDDSQEKQPPDEPHNTHPTYQ